MKQDRKLVAAKQDKGREVSYVARKFGLAVGMVLGIMLALGKNGKYARSRKKIYSEAEEERQKNLLNDH